METPANYTCSVCNAHGVKLWRQYNTFAVHIELMCRPCALKDQKETEFSLSEHPGSCQIGWMVPAVPCEPDTYWGYTSVPKEGCDWWDALEGNGRAYELDEFTKFKNLSYDRVAEAAAALFPEFTWEQSEGATWGETLIRLGVTAHGPIGLTHHFCVEQKRGEDTVWHLLDPQIRISPFDPISSVAQFTLEGVTAYLRKGLEIAKVALNLGATAEAYARWAGMLGWKPWCELDAKAQRKATLLYADSIEEGQAVAEWALEAHGLLGKEIAR